MPDISCPDWMTAQITSESDYQVFRDKRLRWHNDVYSGEYQPASYSGSFDDCEVHLRENRERGLTEQYLRLSSYFVAHYIALGDYIRATILADELISFAQELKGDPAKLGMICSRLSDWHPKYFEVKGLRYKAIAEHHLSIEKSCTPIAAVRHHVKCYERLKEASRLTVYDPIHGRNVFAEDTKPYKSCLLDCLSDMSRTFFRHFLYNGQLIDETLRDAKLRKYGSEFVRVFDSQLAPSISSDFVYSSHMDAREKLRLLRYGDPAEVAKTIQAALRDKLRRKTEEFGLKETLYVATYLEHGPDCLSEIEKLLADDLEECFDLGLENCSTNLRNMWRHGFGQARFPV